MAKEEEAREEEHAEVETGAETVLDLEELSQDLDLATVLGHECQMESIGGREDPLEAETGSDNHGEAALEGRDLEFLPMEEGELEEDRPEVEVGLDQWDWLETGLDPGEGLQDLESPIMECTEDIFGDVEGAEKRPVEEREGSQAESTSLPSSQSSQDLVEMPERPIEGSTEGSPSPVADDEASTAIRKQGRKRCILLGISLVLLGAIASLLVVMLGGNGGNDNEAVSSVILGRPTTAPSRSRSPSISLGPTSTPSLRPSKTQIPSTSSQPTASRMPSSLPTFSPSSSAQPSSAPSYCAEPMENPQYARFLFEYWNGAQPLSGLANGRSDPDRTTERLSMLLEVPKTWERYSGRITAYISPPETGSYIFWVSADDKAELYLSTDNCSVNKRRIAHVDVWSLENDFTKYPTQRSAPVHLEPGRSYYIEGVWSNGVRGGHFQAAWSFPNAPETPWVVDGEYFSMHPPMMHPPREAKDAEDAGEGAAVEMSKVVSYDTS